MIGLNEDIHCDFQIVFNDNIIHAPDSNCSCTIGQSGHYGHITALLYQLAYYKQMNLKVALRPCKNFNASDLASP